MKWIGIALIFSACSLTGIYKNKMLKSRTDKLFELVRMLEQIEIIIRFQSKTLLDIITSIADRSEKSSFIHDWIDEIKNEQNINHAFLLALKRQYCKCLVIEDISILNNFGSSIGKSDLQGQLNLIDKTKKELTSQLTIAKEIYDKKGKMYTSLGIFAGAFISVILF